MEPGCIIGVDCDFLTILLGFIDFEGESLFRFAWFMLEDSEGRVGMGIASLFSGSWLTDGRIG